MPWWLHSFALTLHALVVSSPGLNADMKGVSLRPVPLVNVF